MRTDLPEGMDVAVSLTFDVDAESGWLGEGDEYKTRLSTLSEGAYGVKRGLPRILEILGKHDIKGTFYVPGDTAERHTDAIKDVIAAGHEIGHHGYLHLRSDAIDATKQREEIERASRRWTRSSPSDRPATGARRGSSRRRRSSSSRSMGSRTTAA